ncbi:helix-turn-helix domain-containing protein [Desemzia sp. FAM 23989]|uniref:helix-turn-helix domain-containing protein n=1 Tax=Desemzia sp. FAM 23989 TaxID=3259523 RepID=UPI0038839CF5
MFDRIKYLCDQRGISINDLESALGYSKNTLYRLKKQKAGSDKLEVIADYFGVSTDYLLGRDETITINNTPLDLNEVLDNTMSFDGKPMSENDREAIRAYLIGRFSDK